MWHVASIRAGMLAGCLAVWHLPSLWAADDGPRPYGIPHRRPWTRSRVVGSPEPPPPYRAARIFEKLPLKQPLYLVAEPGAQAYFVVEHLDGGLCRIKRFAAEPGVSALQTLLELDRQIYALCFHPRYQENGYVIVFSNGPQKSEKKFNRLSRFTIERQSPFAVAPDSERVLLEWESNGHNGGEPAFGPDGMLYLASGDGTSDSDPLETGQGLNDLLAVMIRIDIDHPEPGREYSIPPDNPFLHVPGARPEIWAFGFRNPWRTTFDRRTGHLWVTQNGQDLWEQVYLVRKGENYGWSVQEGSHPFYLERPRGPGDIVPPTAEHHHSEARSLTGGVVYYGDKLPELQGAYIYGDYSTGKIWAIRHDGQRVVWHREIADTPFSIVGFAETLDGELAVIDLLTGVYRLEPVPPDSAPRPPFPQQLSETGLFTSVPGHVVDPALIPYSVNSPLWSDGAHKERFIALPGWSQIEFPGSKSWNLPEGAVLVKTFSLEMEAGRPASRRRIETRLLTKQQNEWVGYSYLWNDEQTDATLVASGGLDREYRIRDAAAPQGERVQSWHFPSRTECMVCHSRAATFVLGLQTEQLNRDYDYGGSVDNQLRTLSHLGVFRVEASRHGETARQWTPLCTAVEQQVQWGWRRAAPWLSREMAWSVGWLKPVWERIKTPPRYLPWLPQAPADYGALPDPYADGAPLEARVRSYLHVNCSVCHTAAGGGNAQMELPFATPRDKLNLIGAKPLHDKLGIADARIVAPGAPERSVLLQRVARRGRGQMPPLASSQVDPEGLRLLEAWIRGLAAESTKAGGN